MLSRPHYEDASILSSDVDGQPHAAATQDNDTSAAAAAASTIMDPVKQDQYKQQQQQQKEQEQLESAENDEKKEEEYVPLTNDHHPLDSVHPSLQHNDNVDSHCACAQSTLSNGSNDGEENVNDDDDDDDDLILNFIKTTIDDLPQRNIQAKNNSPNNNARITLNTHNSILSISEDEDDEDRGGATYALVNNDVTSRSKTAAKPPVQRSSPSSCLMDNDDEEDDDDDDDEESSDDEDARDGSFATLDLGVDHVQTMTNGCSSVDPAEHEDACTNIHPVPPLSSSIEMKGGRSSPPPPQIAATQQQQQQQTTPSTLATAHTTHGQQEQQQQQQNKSTSASSCSSCILPQTPPICIRSWCGDATTSTTITPLAVTVATPPPPSIPIILTSSTTIQLPCGTTTNSSAQPLPALPSTTILIKSPKGGGRGFFDAMAEHFVDSLCFPRDDASTLQITSSTSNTGVGASTVTAAPTTNSQLQTPQGQCSTPSNASAAAHTARDVSDPIATSDVAATGTGANSSAQPPCTSNAICGSGSSDDQRSLCLQDDFMALLGCANSSSPNDDEMQKVWAWNQSILECPRKGTSFDASDSLFHPRAVTCGTSASLHETYSHQQYHGGGRRHPRRRELHERAIRVHQLRTERGMPCYDKKPFLGRMKQMLFAVPPVSSTVTKTNSTSSTKTTATTSPTSVTTAGSQMDWPSFAYQRHQDNTHYDNLPMMMDDSFSTACVGAKNDNNGDAIMRTSIPLRRSSRSMDDRILQQECKNDPLRRSKLEEHLNRRIGIGKNGSSTTGPCAGASFILYQEEDDDIGYDSDPGGLDIYTTATPSSATTAAATRQLKIVQNKSQQQRMETVSGSSSSTSTTSSSDSFLGQPSSPLWDTNVVETVQESLNVSWNLTWHPGNNVDANGNNSNSRKIRIWIERGTIINSAKVMLEPNIMWRDFYQPEMSKQRKLNVCMPKNSQTQASSSTATPPPAVVGPFTIRLLNVCRVLEAPLHGALDRSLYPLARPSCSFLLKTAAPDGKEYLFEAATTAERDDIVHRWKICIARFAALAVMEDLDAICREFFAPAIPSRMLVPDDYHW